MPALRHLKIREDRFVLTVQTPYVLAECLSAMCRTGILRSAF